MRAKAWEKGGKQRRKYYWIKNIGKNRKVDQVMRAKTWKHAR